MLFPRFKFVGSKEGQDKFAKILLPTNGFFLDIGCEQPVSGNNTWLLEQIGWKGLLIDKSEIYVRSCQKIRKSPAICLDATKIDWNVFLRKFECPHIIDYISLDVDECNVSVLRDFPLDEYQFKLMTVETDVYKLKNKIKDVSDFILSGQNYYKIAENVMTSGGCVFEDWWANKKHFSIAPIKNVSWQEVIKYVECEQNRIDSEINKW